jgi:formate hydrogenlyase subunit 4
MTLTTGFLLQALQALLLVALAPLYLGWISQCRAWLSNRKGPGIIRPYYHFYKLFYKEVVLADNASFIFRATPYIRFGCMWLASSMVPVITTHLIFASAADVIALVGIFAFSRMFLALSAMDIGTPFGMLGARREMLISFLAEPALLMVFFNASLIAHSTSLTTIVNTLQSMHALFYPGMAFAAIAFLMVMLAENARFPVDNPATHLELTMIHEALILEYSGRYLALIEWSSAIKLISYTAIGIALFIPIGIMSSFCISDLGLALLALMIKLGIIGFAIALFETLSSKLRLFRAPEFLSAAFLLAVLGILTHLLLWR